MLAMEQFWWVFFTTKSYTCGFPINSARQISIEEFCSNAILSKNFCSFSLTCWNSICLVRIRWMEKINECLRIANFGKNRFPFHRRSKHLFLWTKSHNQMEISGEIREGISLLVSHRLSHLPHGAPHFGALCFSLAPPLSRTLFRGLVTRGETGVGTLEDPRSIWKLFISVWLSGNLLPLPIRVNRGNSTRKSCWLPVSFPQDLSPVHSHLLHHPA